MRRDTLLDFFGDVAAGRGEFLVYDDGFRARSYTYAEIAAAARGFAARLQAAGLGKGDKVVFWSENRPEWIIALWGCLLNGSIAVPIDYRASQEFLGKVARIVDAKLDPARRRRRARKTGPEIPVRLNLETERNRLAQRSMPSAFTPVEVTRDDTVEIIFTSGATAEPKGVVLTHRNVLANIVPVEREVQKYRKYGRPVSSHPLSQSASAEPHVRSGHGDVRSSDVARDGGLHARVQPARNRAAGQEAPHFGARFRSEDCSTCSPTMSPACTRTC